MAGQRTDELRSLFDKLIDLPPAERAALLDRACAERPELRTRLEAMVRAAEDDGGFLSEPTHDGRSGGATIAARESDAPGTRIGLYKLLQLIGEGGFGSVYLAEQAEPVRRLVALKIIKLGMDTRQVVARFEQERQALAMMEHPNIARVFDAGVTPTGRPYFVMELVKGVPITKFCDDGKLSARDRLELLIPVCYAVQHAHQKGIIHRDIKPGNILVTLHDGVPVPKVIDFGIAKATGGRLTEKTLFTEMRQFIGTPAYMSPEQAEMSGLDVDTRSDVYSLGVLAYELLTGSTPFDTRTLLDKGYAEIQRVIREVDPPKPSTRVSAQRDTAATVALLRRTEPAKLLGLLRGELDWVVMKCLEKDRTRRYRTADALAADIQAYLAGRPVDAVPASAAYRFRKFVLRNRLAFAAGVLLSLALAAAVAGTSWGYVNAERGRREAQLQRDRARTAQLFLEGTFGGIAPEVARGRDTALLGDLMDKAAARIERGELAADPDTERELRLVISRVYHDIARFDDARRVLKPVTDRFRAEPPTGRDAAAYAQSLAMAGELALLDDDLDGAEASLQEALRVIGARLPDDHAAKASVCSKLGEVAKQRSKFAEAVRFHARALEAARALSPRDDALLVATLGNLGECQKLNGDTAGAQASYDEAMTILERPEWADSPLRVELQNNRASLLVSQNRPDEAIQDMRAVLGTARRIFPDPHPKIATSMHNLAGTLFHAAQKSPNPGPLVEESLALTRASLAMEKRLFGERSAEVAGTTAAMAAALAEIGRPEDALAGFDDAVAIYGSLAPPRLPEIAEIRSNVALTLLRLGKTAEAIDAARQGVDECARYFAEESTQVVRAHAVYGRCLRDGDRLAEAAEQYRLALAPAREPASGASRWRADDQAMLAGILLQQATPETFREAEQVLRDCLKAREERFPGGWLVASTKSMLGQAIAAQPDTPADQSRIDEAVTLLTQGYEGLVANAAAIPAPVRGKRIATPAATLAKLYEQRGDAANAKIWADRAVESEKR